jgi:hypothetical protein
MRKDERWRNEDDRAEVETHRIRLANTLHLLSTTLPSTSSPGRKNTWIPLPRSRKSGLKLWCKGIASQTQSLLVLGIGEYYSPSHSDIFYPSLLQLREEKI